VDEGRKRVILIAVSILAARKLAQYDLEEVACNDECNGRRDSFGGRDDEGN
jgi:hypothetical protein